MNVEQISNNASKCQALISGTGAYSKELYGKDIRMFGVDKFYTAVRVNPELVDRWPEIKPQLEHEDAFYDKIPSLEDAYKIGEVVGRVSADMTLEARAGGAQVDTSLSGMLARVEQLMPAEHAWAVEYMRTQSEIYESIPKDVLASYMAVMAGYMEGKVAE